MKFTKSWKRFWTMNRNHAGGFTLVELIVVIAILAILAGIAIPAYSGYIKKANEAGDYTLLSAINTAFAAACIENGTTAVGQKADIAGFEKDSDAPITVTGVTDGIAASFATYMADNVDTNFAVIEELFFDSGKGVFSADEAQTYNFGGTTITINKSDAAILAGKNAFSDRGSEALLEDVGVLENLLAAGVGDDTLKEIQDSDEFLLAFGSYAGMTQGENESESAYLDRVYDYVNNDATDDEIYSAQIMFGASNAANITDEQLDKLFTGTVTSNIAAKNPDGSANHNQTMANAALAYGMYTAYLQQNPDVDPSTNEGNFTNVVNSDAFAKYYASEQGKTDLEAYRAAMNIISDNSSNSEVTSSIMQNGVVGNADLEALMKEIMGK